VQYSRARASCRSPSRLRSSFPARNRAPLPQAPNIEARALLVVEDSRALREMLRGYPRELGDSTLETAASLAAARDLFARDPQCFFRAAPELNLPVAPDGETVAVVQAAGIPASVLIGTSDDTVRRAVPSRGAVDYVVTATNHRIEPVACLIGRLRENRAKSMPVVDDPRSFGANLTNLLVRYFCQTCETPRIVRRSRCWPNIRTWP
jgi:CheY-like chemotaxis protein